MKEYKCKCGETNSNDFPKGSKSNCKKCLREKAKLRYQSFSKEDKSKYKEQVLKWQQDNIVKYRVLLLKYRAKQFGYQVDIEEKDILDLWDKQKGLCYYSNLPMSMNINNLHTISVERLNSNKGYTKDNTVLCSTTVNYMKNDLDKDTFISIIKEIYNNII